MRLAELDSNITDLEEKVENSRCHLEQNNEGFKAMARRQAKQLFKENGMKRRLCSNQGRPRLLDSDDEEFIAKSIEDKATYHGRRHDLVLYTNRRVKKRDLLNIANFRLMQKGKTPLKSSTTTYNRSRPRSLRAVQAKRHIGKGLFCFKKPPKAEDCSNENTHYQRAHVKNIKMSFFSRKKAGESKLCFMRSVDDKAYIRPGTSEGLEKTRNLKILTSADIEHARKLPCYDWPVKLVYITPGSHTIFTKEGLVEEDGKETLLTAEDRHFVFVRPKAVIPSTGSVWASETVHLRHTYPDEFEVSAPESKYSYAFRVCCAQIHDSLFLYCDMSEDEDIKKVTNTEACAFRKYEVTRNSKALQQVSDAVEKFYVSSAPESERTKYRIKTCIAEQLSCLDSRTVKMDDYLCKSHEISEVFNQLNDCLRDLELPQVKPRWADLTDTGLGVGVSNFAVRFRDAEMARMYNSDYRIRCHRSRGDSGQGEAERTNSAIRDAVVDGATIEWEHLKRFEGLEEDEVKAMTLQDYETYEQQRMESNAWLVAKEITRRIDDAPVLGSYITAILSKKPDDLFYFNDDELQQYQNAGTQAKASVPGAAYITKILEFQETHYIRGELYVEFLKQSCKNVNGTLCSYCEKNEWIGIQTSRIPQPMPDCANPGHFLSVFETPLYINEESNQPRLPDDWQPRVQISKAFREGKLSLEDQPAAIQTFAEKIGIEKKLVTDCLGHCQELQTLADIRKRERTSKREVAKAKSCDSYDWLSLVLSGKINNLKVHELDKYLENYGLSKKGRKMDKVKAISCHVLRDTPTREDTIQQHLENVEESDSEEVSSSDSDILIDLALDQEESSQDEAENEFEELVTTRSGRVVGSWRNVNTR